MASSAMLLSSPKAAMATTLRPLLLYRCMSKQATSSEIPAESCPSFPLLGPPEIYQQTRAKPDSPTVSDPFMDAMVSKFNAPPLPFMGFTENRSPTFLSSGNPCLDFFFHVVPDTPADQVRRRLESAWEQNPLTALKLVCNLRGVRGTGKSDRDGFYASALWMFENHPKTLASNADSVAKFGYFKDLPEMLYRLQHGFDVRDIERQNYLAWRRSHQPFLGLSTERRERSSGPPKLSAKEKWLEAARKAVDRYNNDPTYRALHDKISDIFAKHLLTDMESLNAGRLNQLSFAAKWCPSLNSPYDYSTLLCESIARRVFPRESYPEYQGIEDAHYAYRVRDRLRKQVLTPLRKALKLPEVYMSANQWGSLPYSRVASVAMKNYTDLFLLHDKDRFEEYLESVKKGTSRIAAGALLPHQIIASLRRGKRGEVSALQWKQMVDDLSAKGKLKNCLAICDVSGSMTWEAPGAVSDARPIDVSTALGLLVSELSEQPWKGKLITFSHNPQLQTIKGNNLRYKIASIERMEWEMNTDFQKVFDKILEVAKEQKLTQEQMIKRLFVFSDMEFDQASSNPWETDYQAITRKFHENGYSSVPEIVFWNLRNSDATPVPSHQKGVALVSGFSKNLLKLFLEEGGVLNPEVTMNLAISGKEYDQLVVVD